MWRCTDVGSRTISAIVVEGTHEVVHARLRGRKQFIQQQPTAPPLTARWLNGAPYAVVEYVFDEDSLSDCKPPQQRVG